MSVKAKISGVGALRKRFQGMRRKATSGSVVVGYTAAYALPVHENTTATFQRPGAEAKFLEKPAREMQGQVAGYIEQAWKQGKTTTDGLMVAGLHLQRKSQEIVPIDTGNLRASAFTRKER